MIINVEKGSPFNWPNKMLLVICLIVKGKVWVRSFQGCCWLSRRWDTRDFLKNGYLARGNNIWYWWKICHELQGDFFRFQFYHSCIRIFFLSRCVLYFMRIMIQIFEARAFFHENIVGCRWTETILDEDFPQEFLSYKPDLGLALLLMYERRNHKSFWYFYLI